MVRRIFVCLLAVLCLCTPLLGSGGAKVFAAAVQNLNFDKTDVLADLKSSTIDDVAFSLMDYPYRNGAPAQVINFVEYCYTYRTGTATANYALYVYVYNPSGLDIDTASLANKIQLGTEYGNGSDSEPTRFAKFSLALCSVSQGNYARLFYKFKIVFTSSERAALLGRLNSNLRRYDVSSVELMTAGSINAADYAAGATYKFSGYLQGYGPDRAAPSNLVVDAFEFETVSLEVKPTFYRTGLSYLGKDHQNQVSSVYFAVDNALTDKYGRLQRILAEWYEYKTREIAVTSNAAFYDGAKGHIGQILPATFNINIPFGLGVGLVHLTAGATIATWGDWSYNNVNVLGGSRANALYYLFKVDSIAAFNAAGGVGGVDGQTLANYIYGYNKSYRTGTLPVKNGTISADLFLDVIDAARAAAGINRGYNVLEIDADEAFNLLAYDYNDPSIWQKLIDFGLKWPDLGDSYEGIAPIELVTDAMLVGSDAVVSKRLLIRQEDLAEFKAYRAAAKAQGKSTYIFRFAVSDYYAAEAEISEYKHWLIDYVDYTKGQAYIAQETVFFDFDVIQLTFNRDGVYHTIAAVSNPIDVISGITPPVVFGEHGLSLWDWILIIVALVVCVLIIIGIISLTKRILHNK